MRTLLSHSPQDLKNTEASSVSSQPTSSTNSFPVQNKGAIQFLMLVSGGIAWGSMIAGFRGACVGVLVSLVLIYHFRRE